ncbi:hypothetical protein [Hydrogenophaga sp. 2FB]|uniref:hypothetical protein n=1 Tax=Hydrogenophaga sp. 2FB TaxID=2502187 RepID=UPI0010F5BCB2|nr:hypothetical protein [Hydrogenophaga sp. 2FB]
MATQKFIELREAPGRMSLAESNMRYEVLLNGKHFDELYFNIRGYVGALPTPEGKRLVLPESSITKFRGEIAKLNREFSAAEAKAGHAQVATPSAHSNPRPSPFQN